MSFKMKLDSAFERAFAHAQPFWPERTLEYPEDVALPLVERMYADAAENSDLGVNVMSTGDVEGISEEGAYVRAWIWVPASAIAHKRRAISIALEAMQ